jgi:hypothetical protein
MQTERPWQIWLFVNDWHGFICFLSQTSEQPKNKDGLLSLRVAAGSGQVPRIFFKVLGVYDMTKICRLPHNQGFGWLFPVSDLSVSEKTITPKQTALLPYPPSLPHHS